MSNDATELSLIVGTSALINVVYAAKNKKDAVPVLVAHGMMFVALSIVGGLTGKWELASAFAWVFLIGSIIGRGIPLIQDSVKLVNSAPAPADITDQMNAVKAGQSNAY